MPLILITPPATEPVSIIEAKEFLRVTDTDQDNVITALIAASRMNAEEWLARSLIDQTWDLYLDSFPDATTDQAIQIPRPPLIEVISVKYDDAAGVEQTIDPSAYYVDLASQPGWVVPISSTSWPATLDAINSVRIRFRAGYLDNSSPPVANVPKDIRSAILLNLGTMFEHREQVVVGTVSAQLPWGVENLLRPHRVALGMA